MPNSVEYELGAGAEWSKHRVRGSGVMSGGHGKRWSERSEARRVIEQERNGVYKKFSLSLSGYFAAYAPLVCSGHSRSSIEQCFDSFELVRC